MYTTRIRKIVEEFKNKDTRKSHCSKILDAKISKTDQLCEKWAFGVFL